MGERLSSHGSSPASFVLTEELSCDLVGVSMQHRYPELNKTHACAVRDRFHDHVLPSLPNSFKFCDLFLLLA